MSIGKHPYLSSVTAILALVFVAFLWSNTGEILQASEEGPSVKTKITADADTLSAGITIPNPEAGDYTLSFQGLEEINIETLEKAIGNEAAGEVTVAEGADASSKILSFSKDDASPITINVEVQREDYEEDPAIILVNPTGETELEHKLNFTSLQAFSAENGIQTRSWAGADVFPTDTISLSDVFNNPIGSGPTLMDDGKVLQIVGSDRQQGAIWSKRQIDLTRDFQFTSYIYLGNGNNASSGTTSGNVADGITMTFHNDPRGQLAMGEGGSALGAYGNGSNSNNHISNALSLEFDPYGATGSSSDGILSAAQRRGGHIAVLVPAANNTSGSARTHNGILKSNSGSTAGVSSANRMSNDTWRTLTITWIASTRTLRYNVEDFGEASYTVANLQTTFGGTRVYWGFTGATGALWMDARIAMTEIPGEASHDLKVQNMTQGTAAAAEVEGFKDDVVRFTDVVTPDGDAILGGNGASAVLTLPQGLSYKPGTVTFDGVPIPDDQLTISGQQIKVSNLVITSNRAYNLTFDAEVTTEVVNTSLPTVVELFSYYGSSWGVSDEAIVTIPNYGSVTFRYLDETGTPITGIDSLVIRDVVNTPYAQTPKAIPYYTYDRTVGSATGVISDTPQTVDFYYKRNQAALTVRFVDEKNDPLKPEIVLTKDVMREVDLTSEATVVSVIDALELDDYEIVTRPDNEANLEIPEAGITVTYVFKRLVREAVLTIEFVNEENQIMPGYTVMIHTFVGEVIDLKQQASVMNQLTDLINAGYEVTTRPTNEEDLEITTETMTVRYVLTGLLQLTSAPTSLDFGSLTYNAMDQRVEMPNIEGDSLVVTDRRANVGDGWYLTVALSTPMINGSGQELVNAMRYVYDDNETILDANAVPIYLHTSSDSGSFNISNTWGATPGSNGIKLQIGSSDEVYTGSYVGVITWRIMSGQP